FESYTLGFGLVDYAVFTVMLLVSMFIGLYQALKKRSNGAPSADDFFTGGRSMPAVPVGMSLCASFMSAVQVLGVPAEASRYGFKFLYMCLGQSINSLLTALIFLPIFFRLGITSTNECCVFRLFLLYTGIVIYAPALILNEATGLNLWLSLLSTGIICTLYTTLGGMKAVIWTDVFQIIVMLSGFLAIFIHGTILVGGPGRVLEIANNGSRINFHDFDVDPRKRYTFWSLTVGGAMVWLSMYGVNQAQVQRYISCRTERAAQWCVGNYFWLFIFRDFVFGQVVATCGIVMFAFYVGCDPLKSGRISSPDLYMPHFVFDIFDGYPGFPGLFMACAYSGTLSTASTSINAMAAVTLEDILRSHLPQMTQARLVLISKGLSLVYGVGCISVAVLSSFLDWGVLQGSFTVMGVVSGPLLGVFLLGMFVPGANKLVRLSYCVSIWLAVGSTLYPPSAESMGVLPSYTDQCAPTNISLSNISGSASISSRLQPKEQGSEVQFESHNVYFFIVMNLLTYSSNPRGLHNFYSVSYLYFGAMATSSVVLVGLVVSYATGRKVTMDPLHMEFVKFSLRKIYSGIQLFTIKHLIFVDTFCPLVLYWFNMPPNREYDYLNTILLSFCV
uniref:Solute carrier family 5 member 5 n=1 Tax=Neogobius melanostomus TaxID=47308 RepID=A0A8C6T536_9GOBI